MFSAFRRARCTGPIRRAGYNEPIPDCRQLGNSSYLSRSDRTRNRFLLDAVRQGGDALQPSQVD